MDLPGGPGLRLCASTVGSAGLIPGQGTKVPHAFVESDYKKNKQENMTQTQEERQSIKIYLEMILYFL